MPITPIPGFSEPFSSISHILSAAISFISSFFMVFQGRGNSGRVIGLLIYTFCIIFLFSMSGVYHLLEKGHTASYVLHILDYAGIYCLIAGTFTPIHIILFRGIHRWLVLAIVWSLAITGLTLTAIFFERIPEWLNLTFFLALGWIGLYTLWKLYKVHSKELFKYLMLGGVSYTVGAVTEFLWWPTLIPSVIEPHEVFHIFVMLGAFFHWKLVYRISKYPMSSKITIIVREFPGDVFRAEATSEHASFNASSKVEIKEKVAKWIEKDFHQEMRPDLVNFKYFKEENICYKKGVY